MRDVERETAKRREAAARWPFRLLARALIRATFPRLSSVRPPA